MVLVIILAVIGAIAVTLFLIDSLWSSLELVTSYLMPFFLPTEVQSLTKKFGSWAVAMLFFILAAIGAMWTICFIMDSAWSSVEVLMSYLKPFFLPLEEQSLVKRFGSWAAVTGSTDGVGREYARELARRGLNIVLISRNQEKLKNVAAEIEKESSVKTKIIVADFSKGAEVYSHIEEELRDISLGILVNNVGCQYEYPTRLCELPADKAWELINVNVGAVTLLSRLALAGMVARGRGALVNVTSGSELQPLPLMAVYAATKVYVRSLTLAIREEYASRGIYVQHLSPLFIATKMNAFSPRLERGGLTVPDARTYARHAVATLGRVHDTTGYWLHGIQYFFIKVAPEWMRIKIGMYMNEDFRKEHFESVRMKAR